MKIRTLSPKAIKDKAVIIRVDYNVPIKNGSIGETTRIEETIPTLKYLLKNGAKRIHILSHLGRPKGQKNPDLSLNIVTPVLEKLLGEKVEFRTTYTPGEGRIQLHENVRFFEGETKNDPEFVQKLLKIKGDIFVNDAFGVCHRAQASVVGLPIFLPSFAGFLLEKEMEHLSPFLSSEKMSGLTVIVGGAKIETKVNVLKHFSRTAENIIIGGALANTFLAAQGFDVGQSFYEEEEIGTAREVLDMAEKNKTGIHLPIDVIVAENIEDTQTLDMPIEDVMGALKIFDTGRRSIASYAEIIQHSKTIIWNGPMGCFEYDAFENGTKEVLRMVSAHKKARTILGGGDTLKALKKFNIDKSSFTHVSTGGGAMLEFLEGKDLPGIEALMIRSQEPN
ncbi:MAG TPA: phosphoglycerate kinase [Candidatus Gracilibacteria bacterium]